MSSPISVGFIMNFGWMGGEIYLENLLTAIRRTHGQHRVRTVLVTFRHKPYPNLAELADVHIELNENRFIGYRAFRAGVQYLSGANINDLLWERRMQKAEIDVMFQHSGLNQYSSFKRLAWVPDFQHKYLPEYFTQEDCKSRDRNFADVAKLAEKIILSSQDAANDIHKYFPESKGKTEVLSFCTVPKDEWYGNIETAKEKYGLPERYLIVCNQFWIHKNHKVVFDAIALLRREGLSVNVVCTGNTSDNREKEKGNYFASLQAFVRDSGTVSQVFTLGIVPRVDQIHLLRGAVAVVQPSLFEGWSTVLEDSRVFGKTVIASNLRVHQEQNLDNARYFDPRDSSELATHIRDVWNDAQSMIFPDKIQEAVYRHKAEIRVDEYGMKFAKIIQSMVN